MHKTNDYLLQKILSGTQKYHRTRGEAVYKISSEIRYIADGGKMFSTLLITVLT